MTRCWNTPSRCMRARAKWAGLGCTREKDSHPSMFLAQYLCLHPHTTDRHDKLAVGEARLLDGGEE